MMDSTVLSGVAIAVITAGVTLWTQRGAARARRQTAAIEERAQGLEEIRFMRDALKQDITELREEVTTLRTEVRTARLEASEHALTVTIAAAHIRELRPLVPAERLPPLPDVLRDRIRLEAI